MAKKRTTRRGPSPVIKQRLAACRAKMKKAGFSAFLVTNRPDQVYLTGFTGEDGGVLITAKDLCLLTDSRFQTSRKMEAPWAKAVFRKFTLEDELGKLAKKLRLRKLGIQPDYVPLATCSVFRKAVKPTKVVAAPNLVGDLRLHKDNYELKMIRASLRVAEKAFLKTIRRIRVGQTELEIAARLEYEMKVLGSSRPSFETIVAEGLNAALPHAFPGKRKVRRGSHILIDWGAYLSWYCSDLTRVVFVGRVPPRIREIYEIVLEAQLKAIEALRPGARMCDVDAVARKHIKKAGYGRYFGHGLGHGLGIDIHEAPSLSWRSKAELEPGMVVTVEPGIYLPGVGGVRLEDDVVVTQRGCRVLSGLTKEINELVV